MSFQMLSPVLSIDLKIVDICHTCPIEKSYCAIFIILSAIYSPLSYCSNVHENSSFRRNANAYAYSLINQKSLSDLV